MSEQRVSNQMTPSEALKELRKAWQKGIDIGTDFNKSRTAQRIVIANRIKSARLNVNMTQDDISERINANTLTYKGYENCKSDIPIVYLVRIANVLNVSLDYLTGRSDKNVEYSEQLESRISKLENAVFNKKDD